MTPVELDSSSVREATVRDLTDLTALINEAYLVEEFFVSGPRCRPAEVEALLAKGRFLVSVDSNRQMNGCVYIEVLEPRGYLGLLSVRPDAQGRGLGSILVRVAEEILAATCTTVFIRIVNLRAELPAFYRSRGYSDAGTEPFTDVHRLRQPCHFILMEKTLQRQTAGV